MEWYKIKTDEVLTKLDTNRETGLRHSEVETRRAKYGFNEFEEKKKDGLFKKILHHLKEIPTLVLIGAAIIAIIAAVLSTNQGTATPASWAKPPVILLIVIINVVLGLMQESKAEQALDALKKMNTYKTTVIRDGKKLIIDAKELVPGDIIELNTGDVITADARLISSSSLAVEEAALTGESVPVEKNCAYEAKDGDGIGDRLNMVYSGCLVTGGRAYAVVVETAMTTEMGKIAKMLNESTKMMTPLQRRLKQLAKRISLVALGAAIIMFVVGFLAWGNDAMDMLILAVALGVAAVPETLPIIVTMVLSYGVFNMASKKSIIRKIPAIETIGNTSVICSDKTGTLTLNKMRIQKLWHVSKEPVLANDEFCKSELHMLELLASCSNAVIEARENEDEHVVGAPTEIAIIRLLHAKGLTRVDAERLYPRIHELPFDSGRKRMTTVHHVEDGYLVVTKGAFDRLPVNWDEAMLKKAKEVHDSFADKALRVIGVACKHYKEKPTDLSEEGLEKDLDFVGLVGMIDPPRPESMEAVAKAKKAGIKTVMITGDHIGTAIAIAKEIGIMEEGDRAISGAELALMDDTELVSQVRGISVYARVSPEDKLRIVKAWQQHNEVITMTGDGVNDAPALKVADVGVAMGITGTEVTKSAADMVITDDNFATIVDAIAQGRTSNDNIRKTIRFLLGVNFAEIFVLLLGMLVIGQPTLTALQILLVNVVYDGIPGFFLAFEKPEPNVMQRAPLSKKSGVFANRTGTFIVGRAAMFSVLVLSAFVIGSFASFGGQVFNSYGEAISFAFLRENGNFAVGVTMAFMTLSWASMIDIFNSRTSQSIFKSGPMRNKKMLITALAAFGFSIFIALFRPVAQVFNVVPISIYHWLIIGGLAIMQVVFVELLKLALRVKDKRGK
ncbi:MAG: cation-translocating P-type ATPase [Firmicutes bacterium]|nr:cation-translocating P-type ATPase [Bacillota bacterium]